MISHERWRWTYARRPISSLLLLLMCFHKSKVKWDSGDLIRFHSRNVLMSSIVLELNEPTIQNSSQHSVQRCRSRPVRYMQLKYKWHSFTIPETMTRAVINSRSEYLSTLHVQLWRRFQRQDIQIELKAFWRANRKSVLDLLFCSSYDVSTTIHCPLNYESHS